ncbi:MAG: DMT family transporter [Rhodospirillaceae bacterium]|nr:DMT family transporter [Rhodospirillaceae bacterium]
MGLACWPSAGAGASAIQQAGTDLHHCIIPPPSLDIRTNICRRPPLRESIGRSAFLAARARLSEQTAIPPVRPSINASDPSRSGKRGEGLACALLFVAPVLFATNMLAAKATADLMPPVALAFYRWLGAMLLLAPVVWPRFWRQRRHLRREWPDLLVFGALGMGVCGAFVYVGADTTTATNIGLIYSSSPVLIIAISVLFLDQRIGRSAFAGVFLALFGVLLIIARGNPDVLVRVDFVVGDLWILAAAIGWATYSVMLKHRPTGFDTLTRFFAICLGGVIILLPFTVAEHLMGEQMAWTGETIGWLLLVAVVPGVAAYAAYSFIVDRLGPDRAGLILYLIPPYNAVLAWFLLGEAPAWHHYVGAVLVMSGIWLTSRKPRQSTREGSR